MVSFFLFIVSFLCIIILIGCDYMNNKGFTLVELIATIALLAVLAIISFVSIGGILKKSKINDCKNLVGSIKSVSNEYISDNRYDSSFDSDGDKKIIITGRDLVNKKYLSNLITSPFDSNIDITDDVKIEIILNDDYSAKEITVMNKDSREIDCDSETW